MGSPVGLRFRRARSLVRRWIDARGPRTRLQIARAMAAVGMDRTAIRRLAHAFCVEGIYADARECWRVMRRLAPRDDVVLFEYLQCALDAGDANEAWRAFHEAEAQMGFPPSRVIWLAGELVCRDCPAQAAELLLGAGGDGEALTAALARSPSLFSQTEGSGGRAPVPDVASGLTGSTPGPAALDLARWCYGCDEMDVAARLFDKFGSRQAMSWLDEIAARRAESRAGRLSAATDTATRLRQLAGAASESPDALVALAEVAAGLGMADVATDAVRTAVTRRYAGSSVLDPLVKDALDILDILVALRDQPLEVPAHLTEPVGAVEDAIAKLFVCGFGWTGSGAVYDALRAQPGFCEFEGAGRDALLNEDSDTEATFIQSHAGLGWLWARWRVGELVRWQMLWDLFRCHVIGLGPVGYSEYKAAAAARHHVRVYGTAYTGIFRRVFSDLAHALAAPRRGALHAALSGATEALCAMLTEHTGGQVVLFNNAVFGRDPAMLEIFAGHRAAIVYRDPRDVYVDRLRHDKNHWRTPEQMTAFYRQGLESFLAYKTHAPAHFADALHAISFERFVSDAAFRDQVMHWLLRGRDSRPNGGHFDPEVSRGNIGMYRGALGARDQKHLEGARHAHQRMERRAARTWASNADR